jgi:hypothetical protein
MGAITLQFVTSRDPESWAIRTFQRGWCSHVDSVMDDGRLLGARSDGGVLIRPPNYEKFARVERVVISVLYYKERTYWDFLKAQPGKPYDKLAIAAFAFNRDRRSLAAWFCDELVAAGLEQAKAVRKLAPCVNRLDVRDLYLVVSAIAPANSQGRRRSSRSGLRATNTKIAPAMSPVPIAVQPNQLKPSAYPWKPVARKKTPTTAIAIARKICPTITPPARSAPLVGQG